MVVTASVVLDWVADMTQVHKRNASSATMAIGLPITIHNPRRANLVLLLGLSW
jgi:hypothetical protein